MQSLLIKLGDDPQVIPLAAEPITVGRASQNAIAIMDSSLSRVHCELRRADGGVVVRDMGSRNGTLVNGESVKEKALSSGDRVDVGICRIILLTERGDFKLQVSAGKNDGRKMDGTETGKMRAEHETRHGIPGAAAGAMPDVVAWGKRGGGAAPAAAAVAAFVAVAAILAVVVIKSKKKAVDTTSVASWKTLDYPAGTDISKDWKAPEGSATTLSAATGRTGGGLEVARKPAERGLAEAWGPRLPVESKKAYRFTAWCRPSGGAAGLRIGWVRAGDTNPFAWSGTGLTREEGDAGGTWAVPEGATEAQLSCVVAGDAALATFDDFDFAEATLPDRPPVAGRTVRGVFEAPGVFYFAMRDTSWIPASVGIDSTDATAALDVKRTAGGGEYSVPNPSGGGATALTEAREAEGEGFSVKWVPQGAGLQLSIGSTDTEVDGHPLSEWIVASRVAVGRPGRRVVLELRPPAEVGIAAGRTVIRFPAAPFEIGFQPESGAGGVQAGLEEATRAEAARQFGKALGLYDAIIEKNAKSDLALAAQERSEVLRRGADERFSRARDLRSDAEFTGRVGACDDAAREYLSIERDFDGTEYAAQARAEREMAESLRKQLAGEQAGGDEARMLGQGEAYLNEGRLSLARAFCEAVMDRTTDQDAAARAESLLQRIEAKERDR